MGPIHTYFDSNVLILLPLLFSTEVNPGATVLSRRDTVDNANGIATNELPHSK